MNGVQSVCVDPSSNKVFVADTSNHRVLRFSATDALVNGSAAEVVLGQANFTSGTANRGTGTAANTMSSPYGLYEKSGRLWVSDRDNNRVLRFDNAASKADGDNADGVLGQAIFTSGTANRGTGTAANTMSNNRDVVEDSNGALFVLDRVNNRVLRFDNAASKSDGADADGVLGQANFTASSSDTTASTMKTPQGVAIDGSNGLYVYDSSNSRVLIFNSASGKTDGDPADNVLGQADFISGTANPGGIAANTLSGITRGWFDSNKGRLWVADANNHRMLSNLNTDLIVSTTSTATVIPTMPEWVMIIFMILTGMMAVYKLKRIKISN